MNYVKLLNTLGKLVKEGQIKSIDEAIQMVQKMGAQVDGLLKQGIENLFKKTKARDPNVGDNVTPIPTEYKKPPAPTNKEVPIFENPAMQEALKHFQSMGPLGEKGIPSFMDLMAMNMQYSDKQIFDLLKQYGWKPKGIKGGKKTDFEGWTPKVIEGGKKEGLDKFNLTKDDPIGDFEKIVKGEGKTGLPKEGVENLFQETKRVNIPADKLNHQMIADQAGIDVELIKGKDWVEILEVLKGLEKADGGRIGFRRGGRGRQDPMGGHAHQTAAEMRAAAPDQFGGGMNISHGGGGDQKKSVYIPPQIKEAGKTGIINLGLNKLGIGKYVHPAMMMKGVYDRFKNYTIKDEDLTLSNNPFAGIEDYRADLSKGQMKALNNPTHKFNIQEMGDYGILNDAGFKAQEIEGAPATKEDIDSYYAGTYVGADGGRVGYDIGGLTGQAKNIYDSWIAAGHSSEAALDYLTSRGMYEADDGGVESIINTQQSIGPQVGGEGIRGLDLTYTPGAVAKTSPIGVDPSTVNVQEIDDYGTYAPRTGVMGMWDKTKDFFSNLGTPRVRGTLGTRMANQPNIPLPGALAAYSFSPFNEKSRNYNPNLVDQLNYLEMQDGMIGRDQGSGLLRYGPESVLSGKNVVSLLGTNDYEKMLMDYITKMNSYSTKRALTEKQIAKIKKAEQELADHRNKAVRVNRQASGAPAYNPTGEGNQTPGIGWNETGGPVSNRSGRGRTDWADGGQVGLATMFTRRR